MTAVTVIIIWLITNTIAITKNDYHNDNNNNNGDNNKSTNNSNI